LLDVEVKEEIVKKLPGLILFQCVLKKNSMEFVIQKSTELGADRIVPVISRRTIVDSGKVSDKLARWQKISNGASMQSKRDFKCIVDSPEDIRDIRVSEYDYFFVPYEKSTNYDKSIFKDKNILPGVSSIGFIIGPEGGFEEDELDCLKKKGAREIKLGKNIYRSETAAIYFLSVLDYLIGNKR
jgi:16S rRNA (uracil1498-N3)-methyltransferase